MTQKKIAYDIVLFEKVVDMYAATSSEEALQKWRRFKDFGGPQFRDGLYGYSKPGLGRAGPEAVPAFAP